MSYKIRLDIFEGPLDLLLYLVKKDHLNIYDIPIAKVTEQYLEYLELMKMLDLNIAGEFLVMAATLIQIKSKMLLPAEPEAQEEEEDPREELVRRLLEYEKFKEIAETLRKHEAEQQEVFKHPAPPQQQAVPESPGEMYFEASIFDLISAFTKAMESVPKEIFYEVVKDEYTIEEKTHAILHRLLVEENLGLTRLFGEAKNKLEIVVIFLAILELIKMREVVAFQRGLFEDVSITRNRNNIIPYERKTETPEAGGGSIPSSG